jgi:hypothetical protein
MVSSTPVFIILDPEKSFIVASDASIHSGSAVLLQLASDGLSEFEWALSLGELSQELIFYSGDRSPYSSEVNLASIRKSTRHSILLQFRC